MLTLHSTLLFVVPFAVAAAIPGPAQAVMLARAAVAGARCTLPFTLGMVAGNALWLLAAALGLAALATQFATAFLAVKWAGLLYLGWIAVQLWRAPAPDDSAPPVACEGLWRSLASGAALTLGNPKAIVFFGAVLPQVFDLRAIGGADLVEVMLLGVTTDLCVQGAYLLLVHRMRGALAARRGSRLLQRSAAGAIATSAVVIAARS